MYSDQEYVAAAEMLDLLRRDTSVASKLKLSSVPSATKLFLKSDSGYSFSGLDDCAASSSEETLGVEEVAKVAGRSEDGDNVEHSTGKERILLLAHSTMKYLDFLDALLEKTNFLSYHAELSRDVSLVKVLLYELVRNQFDLVESTSLLPAAQRTADVQSVLEALEEERVKLAAAFARMRIEHQAHGVDNEERLRNLLPESERALDDIAKQVPAVVFPVPGSRDTVAIPEHASRDQDWVDLWHISKHTAYNSSTTNLLVDEKLNYALVRYVTTLIHGRRVAVMITHPKAASTLVHLAKLNPQATFYACTPVPDKALFLKDAIQRYQLANVELVEEEFLSLRPAEEASCKRISYILCEPPNTSGAIVDRVEYLRNTGEYPFATYTEEDVKLLALYQTSHLLHALEFPKIKRVLYITRSENVQENEDVMERLLEEREVDLLPVETLGLRNVENQSDYEECFQMEPSAEHGNGMFVACFKPLKEEEEEDGDDSSTEESLVDPLSAHAATGSEEGTAAANNKKKKTSKKQKRNSRKKNRRSMYWMPTIASQRRASKPMDADVLDVRRVSLNGTGASPSKNLTSRVALKVFGRGLETFASTTQPRRSSFPTPNIRAWR